MRTTGEHQSLVLGAMIFRSNIIFTSFAIDWSSTRQLELDICFLPEAHVAPSP
jgi:hypothetical protein